MGMFSIGYPWESMHTEKKGKTSKVPRHSWLLQSLGDHGMGCRRWRYLIEKAYSTKYSIAIGIGVICLRF